MRASWIGPRPHQEVDSIDRPEIGLKSAECERVMRANDLDRSEIALSVILRQELTEYNPKWRVPAPRSE
jgi:hypothetical protein